MISRVMSSGSSVDLTSRVLRWFKESLPMVVFVYFLMEVVECTRLSVRVAANVNLSVVAL